jgi:sec-independent protein translocase protein TatA
VFLAFLDSPKDWLVILVIVVILFGGAKIPELARSLGRAKVEFNKAIKDAESINANASAETEQDKLKKAAREMGIPVEGRRTDDIRRDLQARLSTVPPDPSASKASSP